MFAFSTIKQNSSSVKSLSINTNANYTGFYDTKNDAFLLSDTGGIFYIVFKEWNMNRRLSELVRCPKENNGMDFKFYGLIRINLIYYIISILI